MALSFYDLLIRFKSDMSLLSHAIVIEDWPFSEAKYWPVLRTQDDHATGNHAESSGRACRRQSIFRVEIVLSCLTKEGLSTMLWHKEMMGPERV